jgi:hypothetical protein
MKKNVNTPMAKICIGGKNELKHYRYKDGFSNVYLKDKTEFSIELFNPTSDVISCELSINGYKDSDFNLVLRPGERFFLDRHIGSPKKFIYETYKIDENDKMAEKAIEKNGDIIINFYKEAQSNYDSLYKPFLVNDINTINPNPFYEPLSTGGKNYIEVFYDSVTYPYGTRTDVGCNIKPSYTYNATTSTISEKETGRVGYGSESLQELNETKNYIFDNFPFFSEKIKILPQSQKRTTINEYKHEFRKYCTNCGKRLKYMDNYCPNCGTKA